MKKIAMCLTAAVCAGAFAALPTDYSKKLTMSVNPARAGFDAPDVADVPVAVRLSEAITGFSYSDFQSTGGDKDLLFTDDAGNALPYEIESWDATGESVVWVRMPVFGVGRRIYAYYGGEETVAQNSAAVWNGFTGVWHMNEASGSVADATGNGLSATPAGNSIDQMARTAGPVGGSRFLADSGTSYLSIPSYGSYVDPASQFAFSGWFKAKAVNGWSRLVSRKTAYNQPGWEVEVRDGDLTTLDFRGPDGDAWATLCNRDPIPLAEEWVYLCWVFDSGDQGYMYVNGRQVATLRTDQMTETHWVRSPTENGNPLSIGNNSNGSEANLYGWIDECRLSAGVKDAARIAAEYAAQMPDVLSFAVSDVEDEAYARPVPTSFAKSFTITADNYTAGDTFTDFPMLVRLSTAIEGFSYDDFIRADHADLAFFDASGNALAFDVDTWNPAGESLVWVKVPSFAAGTAITCCYGGVAKSDIHNPATWSAYRGVWHMNEAGDGVQAIADSTANAMDGSSHTATRETAAGQFGGARLMATNRGASDQNGGVRIPFNPAMNIETGGNFNLVVSAWINLSTGGNWGGFLFSRQNNDLDPGWGMSFHKTEMNDMDCYYRGGFEGVSIPSHTGNGGYYETYAAERPYIGARANAASGTWHKYTVRYYYDGQKIIVDTYFDANHTSTKWLYHWKSDADGNPIGTADADRSYAPLYQPTDRGLALGAMLGDGNYPLLGSMDEVRMGNIPFSDERARVEHAQESNAAYYTYSAAEPVDGSTAPLVTTLSEIVDGTRSADDATLTVSGTVAKLAGDSATVYLLYGVAGEGFSAAANMERVASTNVTVAGAVSFEIPATFGAENAYALVIDNQLDATHTLESRTDVGTFVLPEVVEYSWNRDVLAGDWENAANWVCAASDGKRRLGYPSYGSRVRFNANTKADVSMHAFYGGTSYGVLDAIYVDNANIDLKMVAAVEGAGFKSGSFRTVPIAPVKVVFDGIRAEGGTWGVPANSEFRFENGSEVALGWRMEVNGANALLYIANSSLTTSTAEPYHWLDISGDGAKVVIDNSTVTTRHLYFGMNNAEATPEGLVISGTNAQLRIQGNARVYRTIPGSPSIVFELPEEGFAAAPIVKAGSTDTVFMQSREQSEEQEEEDQGEENARKVNFTVSRNSPFYSQKKATLTQTFVDWTRNGNPFPVDADGINAVKPKAGAWTIGTSTVSAEFDLTPGLSVIIR